jgi:hypothetical protein
MARKRYNAEQIIVMLREGEVLLTPLTCREAATKPTLFTSCPL